ncbi:Hypothetical predicted protein [Paramuricea clavata]|uniref:Uncharacterized protein n=1 Tax=Paramuricea clavata TaxID=317549 RepID=A0A7D9IBF7_PARCT|nr:Hypothetical predicted protein [Paramuricea clavata]
MQNEYSIGKLIVARKYEKLTLNDDGTIVQSEFVVEGRKQPLTVIREIFLKSHANYMRTVTDEELCMMSEEQVKERLVQVNAVFSDLDDVDTLKAKLKDISHTRHLKIWHDLSTVANHSHLIFMVACIYDPALFYTNKEFEMKTKRKVDIQTIVESPEVYIVARSSSSDVEQLSYIETRVECLEEISLPLPNENGEEIIDIMRFFHGDNPAQQYECGQQKGGHYYCSVCGVHANRVYELDYSYRCTHMSLSDRQKLILEGAISRQKTLAGNSKPVHQLKKPELLQELNSRKIYEGETQEDLKRLLTDELHGVQRVPALLYTNPLASLASINCDKYEILPFEPLHDVGKHIENILVELPMHVSPEEATMITETIELCLGKKETKRCFDYRCTLITVTNRVIGKVSLEVQRLLQTLVEIQAIAYGRDENCSPQSVLRFHNLTWLHAFLCWQVIGYQTKKMTCRKFCGVYFHKLSAHAAIQNRLISGKSCHAEEQERVFNAVTNITRSTSSYKPDHIIGNVLLRIQAEKKLGEYHSENTIDQQQNHISKLAKSLPSLGNTVVPFSIITRHSKSWQTHLERISDFLMFGRGVWWTSNEEGDVEFFDSMQSGVDSRSEGPKLHHFRSSNFKEEEDHLHKCWSVCIEKKILLPLHVLRLKDATTDTFIPTQTQFLKNQELSDDASNDASMEDEANSEHIGEIAISTPEEHSQNCFESVGKNDHSHEDIVHYNLIMPMPEDDLRESMLEDPPVDTAHMTAAQEDVQAVNGTSEAQISKDPLSANKEQWHTKLGSTLAYVLGNTNEVIELDHVRKKAKDQRQDKFLLDSYMYKLAVIQTKVSKKKRELEKNIEDWEKKNFMSNNRLPTYDKLIADSVIKEKLRQIKTAKVIMKLKG